MYRTPFATTPIGTRRRAPFVSLTLEAAGLSSQYQVFYAYDGAIEVEVGDLMHHDTDDAKPASEQADSGAETLNQQAFAAAFAGVALEAKAGGASAGTIKVASVWEGEMACASATFEVGDLVTVDEAASGTELENQKVVKTADAASAIGYCIRREGSAVTTVKVRLISRVAPLYLPAS